MHDKLKVQAPVDQTWIGLIDALTWIAFDHSFDLEELLSPDRPIRGSLSEVHPPLQIAWEMLADRASEGGIVLRGKRRRERDGLREKKERKLRPDDLRNCRHLSWPIDSDGVRKVRVERHWDESVTDEISSLKASTQSNEERRDEFLRGGFSGGATAGFREAFARAVERGGVDYADVVVSRNGLMRAWPVRGKRRAASLASEDRAAQWLGDALAERPAATNLKSDIIAEMETLFGLSPTQRDRVWKRVTPSHSEWHRKRGAPKGVRNKTGGEF